MKWLIALVAILIVLAIGLRTWRYLDEHALGKVWRTLVAQAKSVPETCEPALVAQLPDRAGFMLSLQDTL